MCQWHCFIFFSIARNPLEHKDTFFDKSPSSVFFGQIFLLVVCLLLNSVFVSHVGTFSGPLLLVFDLASIPRKENLNKNKGNTNVSEGLTKVIGDHKSGTNFIETLPSFIKPMRL